MRYSPCTIGEIFGVVSAPLAHAPARKGNRDLTTGSRDQRGLLLSGVRSRSGARVMGLDGLTAGIHRPAPTLRCEPHRPTLQGPEQDMGPSGETTPMPSECSPERETAMP